MYLHESLLTISSAIAICIPTLLMGIQQGIRAMKETGQKKRIAVLGSLVGFFTCGGFLVGVVFENLLLPSLPLLIDQLPYYQWSFVLFGIAAFFLLYWSILNGIPDQFKKWKQIGIMPFFHIGSFIALVLFFTNTTNVIQVSNGIESYISMPFNVSVLALLWIVIYLGIVPLYSYYQYYITVGNKESGVTRWILILWIGLLLQFIGYLLDVIQFHEPFISMIRFVNALGWWLILIGYYQITKSV